MTPPLCKHSILLYNLIAQQIQYWKQFWENMDNKNNKSQYKIIYTGTPLIINYRSKCFPLIKSLLHPLFPPLLYSKIYMYLCTLASTNFQPFLPVYYTISNNNIVEMRKNKSPIIFVSI